MILVSADFDEVDVISFLYFKTNLGECFDDTVGQNFPSILHGAYDVIQEAGFVVTLNPVTVLHATNIHLPSLPPKQSFGAMVLVYRPPSERSGSHCRRNGRSTSGQHKTLWMLVPPTRQWRP
jgi:hypothetical protein